jgi:hypothetical protein
MGFINLPPNLKDYFDDITNRLRKLETAQRFTAPNVATNPTNPRNGDNWLNTTNNQLQYLDATGATQTIVKQNSPTLTGTITATSATTNVGALNVIISGATVLQTGNDANGSIELGKIDGTATTPFIDFHANASAKDFDVRLIASAGGASAGQGTLSINAGTINFGGFTTTTTVGAAGGATALPATPLGYIILQINGTNIKIPYYNI